MGLDGTQDFAAIEQLGFGTDQKASLEHALQLRETGTRRAQWQQQSKQQPQQQDKPTRHEQTPQYWNNVGPPP
ncbi:hypothetical protein [Halomonas sp. BC04]|uniref:hypothetical protein n=1 Tax=Halomonas sp. BC04 TaxID=1403540 RepID=UPI0003ED7A1F|nr:hypothetical protein [Halomonas sp. BC04]EWH03285.1 hypothetical protein Q427_04205 [Halomonas sp. BC04]